MDARGLVGGIRSGRQITCPGDAEHRADQSRLARALHAPPDGRPRAVPRASRRELRWLATATGERRALIHRRATPVARTDPRSHSCECTYRRRRLRLHAVRSARGSWAGISNLRQRPQRAAGRAERGVSRMTPFPTSWETATLD